MGNGVSLNLHFFDFSFVNFLTNSDKNTTVHLVFVRFIEASYFRDGKIKTRNEER